jgi:hypothetical protein
VWRVIIGPRDPNTPKTKDGFFILYGHTYNWRPSARSLLRTTVSHLMITYCSVSKHNSSATDLCTTHPHTPHGYAIHPRRATTTRIHYTASVRTHEHGAYARTHVLTFVHMPPSMPLWHLSRIAHADPTRAHSTSTLCLSYASQCTYAHTTRAQS